MYKLIKNKGKFELKFKGKGRLLFQTPNQFYERRAGVYKVLRAIIRNFEKANNIKGSCLQFIDETNEKPILKKISLTKIEEIK